MANKNRDFERGTEPRDTNPGMGADDRVEQVRGTVDVDDDADEFKESDDEAMDEEDEREEGNL